MRSPRRCTDHACSCHCAAPWVRPILLRHHASGSAFSRSRPATGMAFPSVSWRHSEPLGSCSGCCAGCMGSCVIFLSLPLASPTSEMRSPQRCTDHACSCHCAARWVRQILLRHHAFGSAFARSRPATGMALLSVSWRHSEPLGAVVLAVAPGDRTATCGYYCQGYSDAVAWPKKGWINLCEPGKETTRMRRACDRGTHAEAFRSGVETCARQKTASTGCSRE
jgi:hypothetical protein